MLRCDVQPRWEPLPSVPSETTQTVQRRRSALDPTLSRFRPCAGSIYPLFSTGTFPAFGRQRGLAHDRQTAISRGCSEGSLPWHSISQIQTEATTPSTTAYAFGGTTAHSKLASWSSSACSPESTRARLKTNRNSQNFRRVSREDFFRRPPSLSWPPPRGVHIGSGRFLSWPRVRTCGRTCLLLIPTTGAKGVSLMATAHYLDGRGVESDDAAVHVNPSQAMMTDTSKAISDDFSNCSDNSPLSPPKIPADI